MFTSSGTYHADKFEEDADRVTEFYRNHGYVRANLGQPEVKVLEDSNDKKTRWIELRIPVSEGNRYRVGDFKFDGNKVIRSEGLRELFKVKTGDYYDNKKIAEGYKRMKEAYGVGGYWDLNGYPDYKFSDEPDPAQPAVPAALAAEAPKAGPPTVDVTLRILEGPQYFVNRITFAGNTTTYDNVVRREMQLLENSVFNTEALAQRAPDQSARASRAPDENRISLTRRPHRQPRRCKRESRRAEPQPGEFRAPGLAVRRDSSVSSSFWANFRPRSLTPRCRAIVGPELLGFTEPFLFEQHHRRIQSSKRNPPCRPVHPAEHGDRVTFGVPTGRIHPPLYQLQLRTSGDGRSIPAS